MNCIFCKIINGEMESLKLYEDDLVIVIMDAYPNVDGHVLVIPKNHYETLMDIPNDVLIHINDIAKKYTEIIMDKLHVKELSWVVNYGNSQKVKHYHLHLLPNFGTRAEKDVKHVFEVLK